MAAMRLHRESPIAAMAAPTKLESCEASPPSFSANTGTQRLSQEARKAPDSRLRGNDGLAGHPRYPDTDPRCS